MCARLLVSLVALALAAPAPALAASGGIRVPAADTAGVRSVPAEQPRPVGHDAAAGTGSLPTTGFDVGRMAAVAMLMVGAGLLISAIAGPRPSRAAQLR